MFLAKIKNKFMYKTDSDDNGSHWYLVYTRRNKVLFLKGVTHLYIPDKKSMHQRNIGLIEERRITTFETPQGVYKNKIYKNAVGKRLNLSDIKRNSELMRFNIRTKKTTKYSG